MAEETLVDLCKRLDRENAILAGAVIYCPTCRRKIAAENLTQVYEGHHDKFIFVHDEIPHKDSDLVALENGVQ